MKYNVEAKVQQEIPLSILDDDTLHISLAAAMHPNAFTTIADYKLIDNKIISPDIRLNVYKSETDEVSLIKTVSGRIRNQSEQDFTLGDIPYQVKQDGNQLIFQPAFEISNENKWRFQKITLDLYLPEGEMVSFDKSTQQILGKVGLRNEVPAYYVAGNSWVMKEDGLNRIGEQ